MAKKKEELKQFEPITDAEIEQVAVNQAIAEPVPAVLEVIPRAVRDSEILKEAFKIRQDPARSMAARAVPGTPNF